MGRFWSFRHLGPHPLYWWRCCDLAALTRNFRKDRPPRTMADNASASEFQQIWEDLSRRPAQARSSAPTAPLLRYLLVQRVVFSENKAIGWRLRMPDRPWFGEEYSCYHPVRRPHFPPSGSKPCCGAGGKGHWSGKGAEWETAPSYFNSGQQCPYLVQSLW